MKKRKIQIFLLATFTLLLLFIVVGLNNGLTETWYTIETSKVNKPIRIALLTDLHSCRHGEGQIDLVSKINQAEPDLVLMSGDIADDWMPHEGTTQLLEKIGEVYDCYYVTGNHEAWTGDLDFIKNMFRDYGVTVLEGDCAILEVNDVKINLCGVDDPDAEEIIFEEQLDAAFSSVEPGLFTILLSHRPERFAQYLEYDCDLILSGHAHGGQWRIPYLLHGLYAPNQGLFPKYTSDFYQSGETQMLVSRGLSRESTRIPRFFNPPEIVFIDILPANE